MKTECVIKSVKSDTINAAGYMAVVFIVGIVGWLFYTNSEIITSIGVGTIVMILCIVIIDGVCVCISIVPEFSTDPKNKPAPLWWTLAVYTLSCLIAVGVTKTFSDNFTMWFVLNTVFVIVAMIVVRVWVRCKDENAGVVVGDI